MPNQQIRLTVHPEFARALKFLADEFHMSQGRTIEVIFKNAAEPQGLSTDNKALITWALAHWKREK